MIVPKPGILRTIGPWMLEPPIATPDPGKEEPEPLVDEEDEAANEVEEEGLGGDVSSFFLNNVRMSPEPLADSEI